MVVSPAPFEIVEQGEAKIGTDGAVQVMLIEGAEGKMFRRRAMKPTTGERAEILVAELDGVRVYVQGNSVIMTRKDLQP